jgi:non-homologous end joining protein Ku
MYPDKNVKESQTNLILKTILVKKLNFNPSLFSGNVNNNISQNIHNKKIINSFVKMYQN